MSTTAPTLEVRMVAISNLCESKTNPRKRFDPQFMKELTASIKEKGIITPLLVRGNIFEDGLRPIIAGAQRYRAAKELGLESVPCIIRDMTDAEAFEIQTVENLQRMDIHPLDEALGFRALLDKAKYDVPSLAAKIGKSESYVYRALKLADLIPQAQKQFIAGKMGLGHAQALSRITDTQQKEALKWVERGDSVNGLQNEIARYFFLQLGIAAFDTADATLVPKAGPCTTCPKRTGANPSLFSDVKNADTCTDPDCFEEKSRAFVKIQVGTHKDAVLLSAGETWHYHGIKSKGLSPNEWTPAGSKKCPNIKEGVVVESRFNVHDRWDRIPLGKVLMVCTNYEKCKVHNRNEYEPARRLPGVKLTPAEKKQRAKARLELTTTRLGHAALVEQLRKFPEKIIDDDLRKLVIELIEDYQFRYRAVLLAIGFGLKAEGETPSKKAYNGRDNLKKFMREAKRSDMMAFLAAYSLTPAGDQTVADKAMWDVAKRIRVDLDAVHKAASAPKIKSGKCRFCGCTEKRACRYQVNTKDKKGPESCHWIDEAKTICSNPKCIKASKAAA